MSLDIRRTIWLIRGSPLTYWERPPEYSRSQRHLGTGALLETFAVSELVRQAARFADDLGIGLFHYRAHTGSEIDVTAETDDGRVVGIEIKASTSVREEDFSHLAAVRDRVDRLRDIEFVRGIVLYTGDQSHSFGDRLEALPLAALWLPPPE